MKMQNINLSDLRVNRANDRHGELVSEEAGIEWLLTHKAQHMRNLTKDIVLSGEIYEPPLIRKENNHYVVYDGNRRVTALKLLAEPQRAHSQDWSEFFADSRAKWVGKFPTKIFCQVEDDRERLDEILYRRHTGQKSGVGQSRWDPPAKTNFERRTGKNTKIDIAEEVEKLLRIAGRLGENEDIPRSNMKRLFSSEQFRNRAGIAIEKNKLKFTHSEDKVLKALEKISRDLIDKNKTLDDLWDNAAKRKYLDELDKKRILPTVDDLLEERVIPANRNPKEPPKPKEENGLIPKAPEKRQTLIRRFDFGILQTHENRRCLDIFHELQHTLKFEDHDNAIAISFRVLLELSIELYIGQKAISGIQSNDKLANKFRKVLTHMFEKKTITRKYHDSLKKFEKNEVLFSANTLHAYVHHPDVFPSDHHLKSMWDTLEKFCVTCLRS